MSWQLTKAINVNGDRIKSEITTATTAIRKDNSNGNYELKTVMHCNFCETEAVMTEAKIEIGARSLTYSHLIKCQGIYLCPRNGRMDTFRYRTDVRSED